MGTASLMLGVSRPGHPTLSFSAVLGGGVGSSRRSLEFVEQSKMEGSVQADTAELELFRDSQHPPNYSKMEQMALLKSFTGVSSYRSSDKH